MAPSPLHGLNIVQTDSASDQYTDNGQDSLLANAHFPDLAAQLDLWSNLTFQTDESPIDRTVARKPRDDDQASPSLVGDDDKDDDVTDAEGPAPLEAHVNPVNPTPVSNPQQSVVPPHGQVPYDMGSFLAGFGIDPYLLPQITPQPPVPVPQQAATLAQLLATYPLAAAPFVPHAAQLSGIAPAALSNTAQSSPTSSQPASEPSTHSKRTSRPRKASSPSSPTNGENGESPESGSVVVQTMAAAEDKRRRNTAASARFRLKKKEREAALERRAQELEARVNTLERECEGLRRENGWLKGLVVGVTGASQGAQVVPSPSPSQASSGAKRKRGNDEGAVNAKDETKKLAVAA
ncbi:hypothetical protein ACEPAF_7872 [Sanghuangporus sanghuang]